MGYVEGLNAGQTELHSECYLEGYAHVVTPCTPRIALHQDALRKETGEVVVCVSLMTADCLHADCHPALFEPQVVASA